MMVDGVLQIEIPIWIACILSMTRHSDYIVLRLTEFDSPS